MRDLKALSDALAAGVRRGALIHEKTGTTVQMEVVVAEQLRLIGVAAPRNGEHELFRADAKVRVELPLDTAVIYVPGRLQDFRPLATGGADVEVLCDGAEVRQRRMEVRIDADCLIRLSDGGEVEETRTVNLSAGGALVVSESRARVGQIVEVELAIDGQPVHCRAEVVRRGVKTNGAPSRTSAALRFVGLSDELKERIALHVLRQQAGEKASRHK
ncbi:MAG: PilZ domain-containing protein [Deltaproteobacteria bacterium]|nr:PilZ domain-containing protein [Deltaproteobacteria bacterium]